MYVRKIRNQNKISKITLSATEAALARKLGIPLEMYAKEQLLRIAKERRWKWFFTKTEQQNA
jgi:hypothetical protein